MTRVRWIRIPFAICLLAAGVAGRDYTLDELVAEALRNSPEIEVVKAELAKTDAQIWEAKGNALPTISASANYAYSWDMYNPYGAMMDFSALGMPMDSTMPTATQALGSTSMADSADYLLAGYIDGLYAALGGIGGAMSGMDLTMPRNMLVLGLSLQQPLYAQGKVTIGLKIAKQFRDGLLCKFEAARQNVKAATTKLFYGTLLAQENLRIRTEALALYAESHRLALVRQAIGKASVIDTLTTRYAVEQARMELRSAESQQKVASEALIKQARLPDAVDSFAVAGAFPEEDYDITLADAVGRMQRGNKSVGQLESAAMVQQQLVRLQKTDYLPLIYCGASMNKYLSFDALGDIDWSAEGQNDGKVFVGATYTLFNGFQRRQKVKQAQEGLRQFEATRTQALDMLEVGVRAAWEAVGTNRRQLASAEALVSLARKAYDLSKKAYEVGTRTLLEQQQTELQLNGALVALNAARFAFASAVLDLKLLMGEIAMDDI